MLGIRDIETEPSFSKILRRGFAHGFLGLFGGGFSHKNWRQRRESMRRDCTRPTSRATVISLDLAARCAALGFTAPGQAQAYIDQIIGRWSTEMALRATLLDHYYSASMVGMIASFVFSLSLLAHALVLAIYGHENIALIPIGLFIALAIISHLRLNRHRDFEEAMYKRFLETSP